MPGRPLGTPWLRNQAALRLNFCLGYLLSLAAASAGYDE
jgi:hypothetical protein